MNSPSLPAALLQLVKSDHCYTHFTKHGFLLTWTSPSEGDEWKTAVFGNAFWVQQRPAVFQPLVNNVLGAILNRFLFVYMDNFLVV